MPAIAEAREALSEAVDGIGGITCLPYGPDVLNAPVSWIDDVNIDFTGTVGAGTFCLPGSAQAAVAIVGQRHDRPGVVASLESWLEPALAALNDLEGVRILSVTGGQISVNGQDLPSLVITVQFFI